MSPSTHFSRLKTLILNDNQLAQILQDTGTLKILYDCFASESRSIPVVIIYGIYFVFVLTLMC